MSEEFSCVDVLPTYWEFQIAPIQVEVDVTWITDEIWDENGHNTPSCGQAEQIIKE